MNRPSSWSLQAYRFLTGVCFFVVIVLPTACAAWRSVHDETGFTLRAYHAMLTEPRQWVLLGNSLAIAAAATCLATVLGVGAAFALEYVRVPTRGMLLCGVAMAFLIPNYAAAVAWIDVLGNNGLLHKLLQRLVAWEGGVPAITTLPGVVFVSSLSYYPVVALTTAIGLRRFDCRLTEAAQLAARPARVFLAVLFPVLAPAIAAGAVIVFLLSLIGFAVPSLLQINTYPVEVFAAFSAFYDFPAATAHALPLVLSGTVVLFLGAHYVRGRRGWLSGRTRTIAGPRGSSASRFLAALGCWALVAVSSVLPFAVLFWRSLPLHSYIQVFATAKEEIVTSLLVAAGSATAITVLAFSMAYLERARNRARARQRIFSCGNLSLVPFLVSGPVIGVALIATWNRPGLPALVYDSILVVVFACVARFLFFAQRGFDAAMADIDTHMEEAAVVAGVPWRRRLTGILLPLLWPVVAGVWGLSFILCMGELDATSLVCPPGAILLSVRVHSLMHYGPNSLAAALSVITTLVILVCAAITALVFTKGIQARHAPS